jgi:hypothetical protein
MSFKYSSIELIVLPGLGPCKLLGSVLPLYAQYVTYFGQTDGQGMKKTKLYLEQI